MPVISPQKTGKRRLVLGIDLRAFSVKVAEVEISPAASLVKKWGMEEFEESLSQSLPVERSPKFKALQSILQRAKIKTRDAAVCISGPEVTVKHFVLPKISKADTTEAIRLQISGWVSFPAEEAVFDFVALKESGSQVHYLVAVARRSVVDEAIAILKACGLNPLFISVIPLALRSAFPATAEEKGSAVCLVYMGKHNTNINIFKNGVLLFNREVNLGGEFITRSMMGVVLTENERIEIDYHRAEELKRKFGVPVDLDEYTKQTGIPGAQVLPLMRPALEKIEAELLRSFNYYRSQAPAENGEIGRMVVSGGVSKTPNFLELLKGAFGIPVEKGVPAVAGAPGFEESAAELSVAVGAALESEAVKINLLPEEIKNRWGVFLKRVSRPEVAAGALLVFLFLLYITVWGIGMVVQLRANYLTDQIKALAPEAQKMEGLEARLQGVQTGRSIFAAALKEQKQLVLLLEEIGRTVPENVVLDSVKAGEEKEGKTGVTISGMAFSYGDPREAVLARFIAGLEKSKAMQDVNLVSAVADNTYTQPALSFSLSAKTEALP